MLLKRRQMRRPVNSGSDLGFEQSGWGRDLTSCRGSPSLRNIRAIIGVEVRRIEAPASVGHGGGPPAIGPRVGPNGFQSHAAARMVDSYAWVARPEICRCMHFSPSPPWFHLRWNVPRRQTLRSSRWSSFPREPTASQSMRFVCHVCWESTKRPKHPSIEQNQPGSGHRMADENTRNEVEQRAFVVIFTNCGRESGVSRIMPRWEANRSASRDQLIDCSKSSSSE